jgi:hypothetical protein
MMCDDCLQATAIKVTENPDGSVTALCWACSVEFAWSA